MRIHAKKVLKIIALFVVLTVSIVSYFHSNLKSSLPANVGSYRYSVLSTLEGFLHADKAASLVDSRTLDLIRSKGLSINANRTLLKKFLAEQYASNDSKTDNANATRRENVQEFKQDPSKKPVIDTGQGDINDDELHTSVKRGNSSTGIAPEDTSKVEESVGATEAPVSHVKTGLVQPFDLPKEEFKRLSTPIVIFSSYRHEYLRRLVESIDNAKEDFAAQDTECLFVLHKLKHTTAEDINNTTGLLQNISFCHVNIWQYNHSGKPNSRSLTYHWWSVVGRIFTTGINGKLFKSDIFFLEEDIVLSPDAFKVLWFLLRVKNTLPVNIVNISLGSNSGGNLINAHPDTVVVRITHYLQAMAYAFNQSFWDAIQAEKKQILEGDRPDFTEAIGVYYMHKHNVDRKYYIATPTLSRIWHIGKFGLGGKGDHSTERWTRAVGPWKDSPRLIDLDKARVSPGFRDIFGYYCRKEDLSRDTFGPDRKPIRCNEAEKRNFFHFLMGIECMSFLPDVQDDCALKMAKGS